MTDLDAGCVLSTPDAPGAVAIIDLLGPDAAAAVERLVGVAPDARLRLANLADVDEGLVVALRSERCQVMPHGGMRVVHRLLETLQAFGVKPRDAIDPVEMYPEAASPIEAEMLDTLARAASPAAIDLLLDQPRLWRSAIERNELDVPAIERRSVALNRLIDPPTVVVVGRANVGKSTLTNLVMGRAASIVADLPGTTRDWVGGLAELPTPLGELAVRWFDTPGLRHSEDPIEQRAIDLARPLLQIADVLIAMTDPFTDWPDAAALPRAPDLWLVNKADLMGEAGAFEDRRARRDPTIGMAAGLGEGVEPLGVAIADRLGLLRHSVGALWAFSDALRAGLCGEASALDQHLWGSPRSAGP